MNKDIIKAYKVLEGKDLEKDLALKLSEVNGTDIMDLLSLANKVKDKYSKKLHICSIANIQSGKCQEDCKYCAQSAHYSTNIKNFPLVEKDEVLKQVQTAVSNGVKSFGLVSSGRGYKGDSKQLRNKLELVNSIKTSYPELNVCVGLGTLDKEAAKVVADFNIHHYNHNLQVNPSEYSALVSTTHTIQERLDTIKHLRSFGVGVCSGGIFGLGESASDRVQLGFALKDLDVDVIPINILVPIEGTPVFNNSRLKIMEAVKSTAIFRLINPTKTLKLAAGRETVLNDYQALFMLSGINGFLTGGYLTTRGRSTKDDYKLIEELS